MKKIEIVIGTFALFAFAVIQGIFSGTKFQFLNNYFKLIMHTATKYARNKIFYKYESLKNKTIKL